MKTLLLSLVLSVLTFAQVSVPVVPAKPSRSVYGVPDLHLFQVFNRETYLAKFGVQAPPYDATRAPKQWFDSTASGPSTYSVVVNGAVTSITLPEHEAKTVNVPGRYVYETYSPAPTQARLSGPTGDIGIIPARSLSTKLEADAIAAQLSCPGSVREFVPSPPFKYTFPADEPRRQWLVCEKWHAGEKLAQMNAFGIGAPGKWSRVDSGEFLWTPTTPVDGLQDTTPAVPVPVRALLPGEVIKFTPFGEQVSIPEVKPPTSVPESGEFTNFSTLSKQVAELRELVALILQTLVSRP